MAIAIVNPLDDIHGKHISDLLTQKGVEHIVLGSFLENEYSFVDGKLIYNGLEIDSIEAVLFRSNMVYIPDPAVFHKQGSYLEMFIDLYPQQIQFNTWHKTIKFWLSVLHQHGKYIINPPYDFNKYDQLYKLIKLGVPLPKTCVTSSPDIATSFISSVKSTVYKPILGGSTCKRVDSAFLEHLHLIRNEPVILQEEIPGDDVRINMLEGDVLSAHIIIKSDDNILDYRNDMDYLNGKTIYKEIDVPPNVISICHKAMIELGLRFSGIDLRRKPNGEFVLLECNSMPSFLDIETKTGSPISEKIIQQLVKRSSTSMVKVGKMKRNFDSKKNIQMANIGETVFNYKEEVRRYINHHVGKRITISLNQKQIKDYYETYGKKVEDLLINESGVRFLRAY